MHELISIFGTDHNFANLLNLAQGEPSSHDGQMNKLHKVDDVPGIKLHNVDNALRIICYI